MSRNQAIVVRQVSGHQAAAPCHGSPSSSLDTRGAAGVSGRPGLRGAVIQSGRFLLHLAEMVVAMQVGMMIFHSLLCATLSPYPVLHEVVMDGFMVVPMVAVMALHRHCWRHSVEMVGAMLIGPAVFLACAQLNASAHLPWLSSQTLSTLSGVTMYLGMLAAMLYRRRDYATKLIEARA